MPSGNAHIIVLIEATPVQSGTPGGVIVHQGRQVPRELDLPPLTSLEAKLDSPRTPFVTGVEETEFGIRVNTRQSSFRIEDLELVELMVGNWIRTRTPYRAAPAEVVL